MRSTDPSGYRFIDDFFSQLGAIFGANPVLSIGVTVAMVQFAPIDLFGAITSKAWLAAVNGAATGAIASGGNLRATIAGGISGAAFSWASGVGGGEFGLSSAAAFAGAGCVSSVAGGGDCGSGAAGGVASFGVNHAANAFMPELKPSQTSGGEKFQRLIIRVVAGGTASQLGGGKFVNGALSGAMMHTTEMGALGGAERALFLSAQNGYLYAYEYVDPMMQIAMRAASMPDPYGPQNISGDDLYKLNDAIGLGASAIALAPPYAPIPLPIRAAAGTVGFVTSVIHYSRNPNFENFVDTFILDNLGKGVGPLHKELGQSIDNINFTRGAATFIDDSNKRE